MILSIFIITTLVIADIIIVVVGTKAFLAMDNRIEELEKITRGELMVTKSSTERHQPLPRNIEEEVSSGLMKGLMQLRENDENQLKLLALARSEQNRPMPVMNHNSVGEDVIDTQGDLIPANLNNEERTVLRMFYEKS